MSPDAQARHPGSLALCRRARRRARRGEGVSSSPPTNSPLGPSPKAVEALRAAAHDLELYPDGSARLLREAIGEVHGLDPDRIVAGGEGSGPLLTMLANAYLQPGDEAIFSRHAFLVYEIATRANSAMPVMVPEKTTNQRHQDRCRCHAGGGDAQDAHGLYRQSQQSHRLLSEPRGDGAAACRPARECAAGDRCGLCRICHRQGL